MGKLVVFRAVHNCLWVICCPLHCRIWGLCLSKLWDSWASPIQMKEGWDLPQGCEDKLQIAPVVSSLLGAGAEHGAVDANMRNSATQQPWQIVILCLVLENPFAWSWKLWGVPCGKENHYFGGNLMDFNSLNGFSLKFSRSLLQTGWLKSAASCCAKKSEELFVLYKLFHF